MEPKTFADQKCSGESMARWKRRANQAAGRQLYKPTQENRITYDRFIPNPNAMNYDIGELKLSSTSETAKHMAAVTSGGKKMTYSDYVAAALFGEKVLYSKTGRIQNRILGFKPKPPSTYKSCWDVSEILYGEDYGRRKVSRPRVIPTTPQKILDAPGLSQDFYLNLLDWSEKNMVAIALAEVVYLWNADTGQIQPLCETSNREDYISSLRWSPDGETLAVGTSYAKVELYDVSTSQRIRSMVSHGQRVGCLSWNRATLSSGSMDSEIHNHDVRERAHLTARLIGHEQEVCGLAWSPNGRDLASGGNDNLVHIWNAHEQSTSRWTPKFRFDRHRAAVKALAWCPWQRNLLATGGGSADKHLRFWNTQNGRLLREVDTENQVTGIVWNPHEHEVITTHGFSRNNITMWKYPSFEKVIEITGNSDRVLHSAINPEGTTVVTSTDDETLRFWDLFETPESRRRRLGIRKMSFREEHSSLSRSLLIR